MKILLHIIITFACAYHAAAEPKTTSGNYRAASLKSFPTYPNILDYLTDSDPFPDLSPSQNSIKKQTPQSDDPFADDNYHSHPLITPKSRDLEPLGDHEIIEHQPELNELTTNLRRITSPEIPNISTTSDISYDITPALKKHNLKTHPNDRFIFNKTRNAIITHTSPTNLLILKNHFEVPIHPIKILSINIEQISIPKQKTRNLPTLTQLQNHPHKKTENTASTFLKQNGRSSIQIPRINPFQNPAKSIRISSYRNRQTKKTTISIDYRTATHKLKSNFQFNQQITTILPLKSATPNHRHHYLIIQSNLREL